MDDGTKAVREYGTKQVRQDELHTKTYELKDAMRLESTTIATKTLVQIRHAFE